MRDFSIDRVVAQDVPDAPRKIAVVGLTDAGKTSLLKILFHNFDAVESLTATRQIERSVAEFLHHPLKIWDFGGQEKYREGYLQSPEIYFQRIAQLFYVVDVQNTEKIAQTVQYFEKIVSNIRTYSPSAHITILYNKFDPNYPLANQMEQNQHEFKTNAMDILTKQGFGYQAYKTSIFVPVWIMTAFSKSMLENPAIYDKISQKLKEFSNTHDLQASLVFTQNGFGLGYHFAESLKSVDIRDLFIKFFTKFEQMYNIMPTICLKFDGLNLFSTRFFLNATNRTLPIYFGFLFNNSAPNDEIVAGFLSDLREALNPLL